MEKKDIYELTNPQKSIWNTELFFSNTTVNNICVSGIINEEVSIEILKKAINLLVKENDSFRTKLIVNDSVPVQFFSEYIPFNIDVIKVENKKEFNKIEQQMVEEKFNLINSELYKFKIIKFPDNTAGIILNVHHMIADSWSLGITIQEIVKIYKTLLENKEYISDTFSYKNYIESEREYKNSKRFSKDKEFWNEYLSENVEPVSIPSINRNIEVASSNGKRVSYVLKKDVMKKIAEFCEKNKISNYVFFMSVFSIYIGNMTNTNKFLLGTPILNRLNFKDKKTAGMFVTTVPFKVDIENNTFTEFAIDNNINLMSVLRHQKYSYTDIIEDVRTKNPDIPNLYDIAISYQITKATADDIGNYTTNWTFNNNCLNDMNIHLYDINDTGELKVDYDFLTDKYSEKEIENGHNRIIHIIEQIIEDPDINVQDIEIVTNDEKEQIVNKFNNRKLKCPFDKNIIEIFEEQVVKNEDEIALVYKENQFTYKELNKIVNKFARFLKEQGINRNDIVGVYMNKNYWFIISILAIQKLGAAYTPMHPEYPEERVNYILNDCNSKVLITDQEISNKEYKIINPNQISLDSFEDTNLNEEFDSNTLCYVIYTSGSTGKPKGVMLTHRNLINFVYNFNDAFNTKFSRNDNCLSLTNISFDVSVCEIFTPLTLGATLVIYPENTLTDIHMLCDLIEKEKITFLYLPPSVLKDVYEFIKANNYKFYVEKMLVGVEAIKNLDLNNLLSLNENLEIVNGYGPTEATICSTFYKYELNKKNDEIVPIGYPLKNNDIYIINKFNNLQPVRIPGELIISGDSVSLGYLNNPEKTEESFKKLPKFKSDIFYKTGDISYWNEKGFLNFIGRQDSQIKFRGHRIELNEINNNIKMIKGVTNSITVLKNINGIPCICSYLSNDDNIITEDYVKIKLNEILPYYMIPTHVVCMEQLPINKSGKVDKKSLPEIELKKNNVIMAETETQKFLVAKISKLLNIDKVSIDDDFFTIGMDSLLAIRFSMEIYNDLKVNLSIKEIFSNNNIQKLAEYLDNSFVNSSEENISQVAEKEFYELSSAQKRIYYASKMIGEENIVYNVPGAILVNEILNKEKVEKCFKKIIEKQSVFRTCFVIDNEEVKQKIQNKVKFNVETFENESSELENIINNFPKPFNLEIAPLLRVELHYLDSKKTLLLLDSHHIIMDGSSLEILINDFCKLYNGEEISKLDIEYKDFAEWEQKYIKSESVKEVEEYWINKFKDSDIPSVNLPYDYNMPSLRSYKGNTITKKINKKDFNKYLAYAKELGVSPYMFFLSAFFILLYKYTGQEELILGTPTAGRDKYQLKNIIGMFVNNLVVDAKINSSDSFIEFLQKIKQQVMEDLIHQDYPYDLLVKKLNITTDNSRNPLFDIMFIYQNTGDKKIRINGEEAEILVSKSNISKFDLSVEIDPDKYIINLEYRVDLFKENTCKRLLKHYINALNCIVEDKNILIKDIVILSDSEKNKILNDFNSTYHKYDKECFIHKLFEKQVEATPDETALVFEGKKLTYKELNEKANAIAYYLRQNNYGANDIIGIMLPRSLELIIAILGVLKAGTCYIPIDPSYPQNRIEYMLENSKSKVVLTVNKLFENIKYSNKICIDIEKEEIYSQSKENLNCKISPEDSAYIIYTSGSTGLPKGVVLKHKSLTNLCYYLNDNTEFLQKNNKYKNIISVTTSSFDIFVFETLICLQRGLKIILANEEEQRIPSLLNKLIKENNGQIIQMTPSRMQFLIDNIEEIPNLSELKYVVLAGEPLPLKLKDDVVSMGIKKVYNGYGPSETTVFSTFTDSTIQTSINIGKPLYNTQMYILDNDLNPVPTGINGELYIAGDGVGKGYLNNPEITNQRFITNPFNKKEKMYKTGDLCKFDDNGELYYVERIDNQVKIRGLRIELGEIESKILEFPFIKKAVVIKQKMGDREIISAYFIATRRIRITDLRKSLANALPSYMIPSYFTPLDELPYTPNGKINKNALPVPNGILDTSHKYIPPKTDLEVKLVSIWENILNTKPIGITDNFFELGGDSILAMTLNVQLLKITDKIKYSDIFSFPTILELEDKINEYSKTISDNGNEKEIEELKYKYDDILEKNIILPKNLEYKNIGNILLTGATGFLGIHILDAFLQNEEGKAYVIIRKEPGMTIKEKFLNKLHYYFGEKYDNQIGERIIIIEGDTSLKAFGLNQDDLFKIINSVDTIINAAAKVSHYGSYQEFYMINVKSVENIINITHTFNKKLYHISTLSVSGNSFVDQYYIKQEFLNNIEFSEKNFYIGQSLDNVYIKSKFDAERLVFNSILNGDDSYILRVGNLMPRYSDGKFQENIEDNAYINRLKSFINIECIPRNIIEAYLELTPIDYTAEAILKIIQYNNKNNRVFHLFNNNHVFIKQILNLLKRYDINIKIVESEEFKKIVKNILSGKSADILSTLVNDLDKDMNLNYENKIKIKSEFTIKYLELCDFKWPLIKERYIEKIVKLLKGE